MGIVTKCISQVAVETEQCILLMRLCIMFHLTHFALNAGNMSHIYPFVLTYWKIFSWNDKSHRLLYHNIIKVRITDLVFLLGWMIISFHMPSPYLHPINEHILLDHDRLHSARIFHILCIELIPSYSFLCIYALSKILPSIS